MPQLVTVRVTRRGRRTIRVWVPVLPVALVLTPLLAVGVVVTCLVFHIRVGPALRAAGRFVAALPGTRFDMAEGSTAVLVTIR